VRDLVEVLRADAHPVFTEVPESDERSELAAEHRPVEFERLLGVAGKVEIRMHRSHGRSSSRIVCRGSSQDKI
jgi:hypothetical protein